MLVGDIIRRTAAKHPDKAGVVFEDKRYTWEEVNRRVNCLANGLLQLGLQKQDRVAILSHNCNQYLEFYFATAKAGLIAVPLNTMFLGKELTFLLNDSGANTLITDTNYLNKVESVTSELPHIKHYIGLGDGHPFPYDFERLIAESPSDEPEVTINDEDLCVIAYTSGTTGRPKGAMVTHQASWVSANALAVEWRTKPHWNYLLPGPFFFAAANFGRYHAIMRGCTVVILRGWDAATVLQTIEREKINGFNGGPTVLARVVNHPDVGKYDLSSMRIIVVTGGPLPLPLWQKTEEIFGPIVFPAYGLTESCGGTLLQREDVSLEGPANLQRRTQSIGRAMIHTEARVVDETGKDVACNDREVGELLLRSDGMIKGYWNLPEETAKVLEGGWLHTGDLATMDEDRYIYIVDRKKDIIKSGGVQIWPREVEDVIYTHPAVLHCAVIGVPDEKWGETPKAVIALKKGAHVTEEEIIELCKQNLASFKKPTSVEFVDELPLTPSGKVLKRDLRKSYRNQC